MWRNSWGQWAILPENVNSDVILDALPTPIAVLDPSGKIVSVNEAWRSLGAGQVGEDYRGVASREFRETITAAGSGSVVMLQPNSAERWSRLYAMSSAINEAILRTSDPLELYQAACRIAVEGGMLMSWVGFARGSDFEVVARWGLHSHYLDGIRLSINQGPFGNGPSGRAFRSGVASVCNDIAGDQIFAPWREAALDCGYRSSAAFPLKENGEPVGLFCVYGDQPGLFDEELVRLLTALADNLSFSIAMQALAREVECERARLLEAQSVAKVGSWETDLRSLRVVWSPQTHRIFETDPLHFQPTHKLFLTRVHPEDLAQVTKAFEASLLHEQPCVIEHRILTERGEIKVVEEHWQVFRDAEGVPERALGTCLDISQRHRDKTEAARASQALADLVQIQQDLTVNQWTVPEAMEFLCRRSQALTGAAGASIELVEGEYLKCEFCSGVARPYAGQHRQFEGGLSGLAVKSGVPLYAADTELDERVDRQGCRQAGVRSLICAPLCVANQVIGLLNVISDQPDAFQPRDIHHLRILTETLGNILERQQGAEALRASGEEFRTLAESMPQIVWTTDPTGSCNYINRLWAEYTGRGLEEGLGDGWLQCFHPDDLPASRVAWEEATRTLRPYAMEFRLRRADGEYRWWLNRGEPLRNEQGEVIRWLGTSTDIHDLTVANRALQMLRHCAEALVRADTEPQLLQSICDIAVHLGGYRMAWVGYAHDGEAKTIEPQAHAGEELGYLTEVQANWAHDQPGARIIREGRAIHIADLAQEPSFAPWLAAAQARGYHSLVYLPLREEACTFGHFGLFRGEAARLSADELRLLQDLADDLAFGIVTLRARAERQRLQDAVLAIARGVSASLGADFFCELTRHLVDALQADAGYFALLDCPDPSKARTVAAMVDGKSVANFEYCLKGNPCQDAVSYGGMPPFCNMQACASACVVNSSGECVGTVVVLFAKPIRPSDLVKSTLQIFAARAASELERQQSEARVREQASFLDKAQDAILVCDLEQRVSYWNHGAERLYGWSAPEAQGRRLDELLQTDSRAARAAVLESGEWQGEVHHQSRQGESLTLSCRWTLVLDGNGAPQSILSIATDITERKRLEEQFLRAQRLESIGTLAGGIAHDLNNALSPILMSVELLRLQFPDAESEELVESIANCAERGAEMVRQLLAFARGVEGERVAVPIAGLLKEVAKIANDTFLKSIQVDLSIDNELWSVSGDPTQIQQVLMNLCVNARDAMPGGGDLLLSAQNHRREGQDYVLLQVKDQGTGISADILEKIFDPFFTTKEVGQGTGLGLSTSLAIVKSHGGFLQVHSELGQGATFSIYLPARAESTIPRPAGSVAELPRGDGELVLVVDDEESVRKLTRRTLEAFGYRVLLAADGAEAMKLYELQRGEIRVVLTDMMMPIQDGPALIKALRHLDPDLPVIGASGLTGQDNLGLKHLLPKPYKTELLLQALRDLLSGCDPEPVLGTGR